MWKKKEKGKKEKKRGRKEEREGIKEGMKNEGREGVEEGRIKGGKKACFQLSHNAEHVFLLEQELSPELGGFV